MMTPEELEESEKQAVREQQSEAAERKREYAARMAKAAEIKIPTLPDTADVRELARAAENDAFRVLYEMMMDDDAPAAVRKACADAVLDRSRGKAAQEGSKGATPDKQEEKVNIAKEKILKAIPNDKLNALISELNEAGLGSGTEQA